MMQNIKVGAALVVAMIIGSAAFADVQKGLAAKAKQDYKTALSEFRKSADAGDPEGMYNLGRMYVSGLGVPQDDDIYIDWTRRAAEQGYAPAENAMGWIYTRVRNQPEIGFEWYMRAAAKDDLIGLENVGAAYRYGKGVEISGEKALEYYTKAHELGSVYAGYQIGTMYHSGKVIPKDFAKAAAYFKEGAKKEYALSEFFLAYVYRSGEGVETDYDAYEDYRRRAARHGLIRAQLELGETFTNYFADDDIKSYQTGAEWYEMAALQGSLKGMVGVLNAYRSAREAGDPELSTEYPYLYWLDKAAYAGDGRAAWELGGLTNEGSGVEKDEEKAQALADLAVAANYPEAMHLMGRHGMQRAKTKEEFLDGFELIYGAAVQSDVGAMLTLAMIFDDGAAVETNKRAAYLWALQADEESYGAMSEQVETVTATILADMDPGLAHRVRNDHKNCYNFYSCVLGASNFNPDLEARLEKYDSDYYR